MDWLEADGGVGGVMGGGVVRRGVLSEASPGGSIVKTSTSREGDGGAECAEDGETAGGDERGKVVRREDNREGCLRNTCHAEEEAAAYRASTS